MEHELVCKKCWIHCLMVGIFLLKSLVNGDVYVRGQNDTQPITYFMDLMADFGPEVPDDGITGFIHPVKPLNACAPVEPPPDNTSTWIALIARDNCTFADKVRNVQPWYKAAIVFNRKNANKLERMHGDGRGIYIPSVFVGWSDGRMLQTDYCYFCKALALDRGNYVVTVDSKEYTYNPYLLWPFAVVVGTCFILMLMFMIFKWCRDLRRKRKSRLSSKHLKKIPTKKFKKGDEYDVCAICLDDYEEGNKLRLLPCSHVYHCACIDPWLTKNKRCCPICKRKVIPGDDPDSDSDDSDNDGDAPSERTPLLGGGQSSNNNNRAGQSGNNNNNRSTFVTSGLPEPVGPQRVRNVQESTETDTDNSDSEYGAVGGAPSNVDRASHTEAVSQRRISPNSALQTEIVSEINTKTSNEAKQPVSKSKTVTKEIVAKKETVARDVARGEDNETFEVESDNTDSSLATETSSEVYFTDTNRKEEKKMNHVV